MKLSLRLLAVQAIAGTLLAGAMAPVSASETHTWTNKHATPRTAGYAKGHLHVEFLDKRTVDFDGWVLDICPGDEDSAVMWVKALVRKRNGKVEERGYWYPWLDDDGCAAGTKKRFDPGPKKVRRGEAIVALRAELCQKAPTGGVNDWPYRRYHVKRFANGHV